MREELQGREAVLFRANKLISSFQFGALMTKYSELSSVAWVNSWWLVAVFLCVVAVSLVSGLNRSDSVGPPLLGLIFISSMLMAYPYIHYRVNGGLVQRIAPRFVPDRPFMSEEYA